MRTDHPDGESRARFRASLMAKVPTWYRPSMHLSITAAICLIEACVALAMIRDLRGAELLLIPPALVFLNAFEWFFHRTLMHRRKPWTGIYRRHTLEHHRIYRWGDMGVRQRRELFYVLMPTSTIAAFAVLSWVFALVPWLILGGNAFWLFLLCEALYVLAYELTHLAYHAPDGHWVKRSGIVRALAEHHSRHHEPKLMQKWNFNITLPLADLIFRTMAPKALVDEIRGARRGPGQG
jgi:hypothetical protein